MNFNRSLNRSAITSIFDPTTYFQLTQCSDYLMPTEMESKLAQKKPTQSNGKGNVATRVNLLQGSDQVFNVCPSFKICRLCITNQPYASSLNILSTMHSISVPTTNFAGLLFIFLSISTIVGLDRSQR